MALRGVPKSHKLNLPTAESWASPVLEGSVLKKSKLLREKREPFTDESESGTDVWNTRWLRLLNTGFLLVFKTEEVQFKTRVW